MKTVKPRDLLAHATEMSMTLAGRLRDFNKDHAPEVQPLLDGRKLDARLQESIVAFLARRLELEMPDTSRVSF